MKLQVVKFSLTVPTPHPHVMHPSLFVRVYCVSDCVSDCVCYISCSLRNILFDIFGQVTKSLVSKDTRRKKSNYFLSFWSKLILFLMFESEEVAEGEVSFILTFNS